MADGDFDLSSILSSLGVSSSDSKSLGDGLLDGFTGGGGGESGGAGASWDDSAYGPQTSALTNYGDGYQVTGAGRPALAKASRLLGAALRFYGPQAMSVVLPSIAQAVGLSASTIVMYFLGKKGKSRRRRGITYRQLANARRVNRTIGRMYHSLHKGEHHRSPAPYHRKGKR